MRPLVALGKYEIAACSGIRDEKEFERVATRRRHEQDSDV